jgi:hypothetical protein
MKDKKMFWDAEILIFLLYFIETDFQNSPKNPLIPQRPKKSPNLRF